MTHTYKITGMTCGGCAATAQKLLSGVSGVTSVDVNLEKHSAEINMPEEIATSVFQAALAKTNYKIAQV